MQRSLGLVLYGFMLGMIISAVVDAQKITKPISIRLNLVPSNSVGYKSNLTLPFVLAKNGLTVAVNLTGPMRFKAQASLETARLSTLKTLFKNLTVTSVTALSSQSIQFNLQVNPASLKTAVQSFRLHVSSLRKFLSNTSTHIPLNVQPHNIDLIRCPYAAATCSLNAVGSRKVSGSFSFTGTTLANGRCGVLVTPSSLFGIPKRSTITLNVATTGDVTGTTGSGTRLASATFGLNTQNNTHNQTTTAFELVGPQSIVGRSLTLQVSGVVYGRCVVEIAKGNTNSINYAQPPANQQYGVCQIVNKPFKRVTGIVRLSKTAITARACSSSSSDLFQSSFSFTLPTGIVATNGYSLSLKRGRESKLSVSLSSVNEFIGQRLNVFKGTELHASCVVGIATATPLPWSCGVSRTKTQTLRRRRTKTKTAVVASTPSSTPAPLSNTPIITAVSVPSTRIKMSKVFNLSFAVMNGTTTYTNFTNETVTLKADIATLNGNTTVNITNGTFTFSNISFVQNVSLLGRYVTLTVNISGSLNLTKTFILHVVANPTYTLTIRPIVNATTPAPNTTNVPNATNAPNTTTLITADALDIISNSSLNISAFIIDLVGEVTVNTTVANVVVLNSTNNSVIIRFVNDTSNKTLLIAAFNITSNLTSNISKKYNIINSTLIAFNATQNRSGNATTSAPAPTNSSANATTAAPTATPTPAPTIPVITSVLGVNITLNRSDISSSSFQEGVVRALNVSASQVFIFNFHVAIQGNDSLVIVTFYFTSVNQSLYLPSLAEDFVRVAQNTTSNFTVTFKVISVALVNITLATPSPTGSSSTPTPVTAAPNVTAPPTTTAAPTGTPAPIIVNVTSVKVTMNRSFALFTATARDEFLTAVANALGISKSTIRVVEVKEGSVIITLYFATNGDGSSSNATLANTLTTLLSNTSSPLASQFNVTSTSVITSTITITSAPVTTTSAPTPAPPTLPPVPTYVDTFAPRIAPTSNPDSDEMNTPVIIAIVVGCTAGVMICTGVVYYAIARKRKTSQYPAMPAGPGPVGTGV